MNNEPQPPLLVTAADEMKHHSERLCRAFLDCLSLSRKLSSELDRIGRPDLRQEALRIQLRCLSVLLSCFQSRFPLSELRDFQELNRVVCHGLGLRRGPE